NALARTGRAFLSRARSKERLPLGNPHRAHHEGGHVVAHALLLGPRRLRLRLGRRARRGGAFGRRGGLGAVRGFPVAVMVWFMLIALGIPRFFPPSWMLGPPLFALLLGLGVVPLALAVTILRR